MIVRYAFVSLLLTTFSSLASAQDSKLPYPPAASPLYLDCKLQGVNERKPYQEWDRLVLYFPDGSDGVFLHVEILDPKKQISDARFSFTMKNEGTWSLYATDKVPSSGAQLSALPAIVFLPPSGEGETLKIGYAIGGDVQRQGVCLGMIGPDTKAAFEQAKKDSL